MKIGILGGSFNPIHHGHLLMAQAAMEGMGLDEVIFVPAACSPHKADKDLAPAKDRLAMARAAIKGEAQFSLSDCEIKRGGKSYSIDTVRYFRELRPKAELFWIIGADSLSTLHTWKDIKEILKIASFIAVNRPGCKQVKPKAGIKINQVMMPGVEISSSDIRRRLKAKKSIRYLTTDPVIRYILKKNLYA